MQSKATTITEYLKELPSDRRKAVAALRKVVKANLPKGYVEALRWGGITYEVPLKTYPDTYNGEPLMYAGIGSQKHHIGLYLMCAYENTELREWFEKEYAKTGRKLDMGKSCVRFKKFDEIPLELVGKVIKKTPLKKFIAHYEQSRHYTKKK